MRVDGMDTVMLSDVFGDIGLLKCDLVKIELPGRRRVRQRSDQLLCLCLSYVFFVLFFDFFHYS